jgi:hypothetical protein
MSTVPDLQVCVLRAARERAGESVVVDLRRVWFCDLAGLRSVWWLRELGQSDGTGIEVRESAAITRIGGLVDQLRAARIA